MDSMMHRKIQDRGFTLIELMMVVSIIGILASVAIPGILRSAARAQRAEVVTVTEKMRTHFLNVYRNQGSYPDLPGGSAWNPGAPGAADLTGQKLNWNPTAAG